MKHHVSPKFWALYEALPTEIRQLADKNYHPREAERRLLLGTYRTVLATHPMFSTRDFKAVPAKYRALICHI